MPEETLPPLRPPTPSLKRKRTPEVDDSPFTIGQTAAAALAADRPARIVPKPLLRNKRTEEDGPRRCDKCESAEESPENLLVVCPVCGWSWHQRCHDPEIGAGSVRDRVRFKCAECVREGAAIDAYRLDKLHQDQISSRGVADVEKLRNARLAELPAFNKPELVGFKAGDADRETALTTPASLPRLAPPKVRQPAAKPVTKRPKTSAIRKVQETETIADQPDEEPLPGIWPEAGIGLYSKLPPELPDPILLGQNDEEAFSGFMIDRNGRPVEPAFGKTAKRQVHQSTSNLELRPKQHEPRALTESAEGVKAATELELVEGTVHGSSKSQARRKQWEEDVDVAKIAIPHSHVSAPPHDADAPRLGQDPPPQRNPPEIPHCNHKHRARDEPVARLEHGAPEVVAWREDSRPRYVRRERDEDRQETRGDAQPHEEGDGVGGTENAQQREEGVEDEENESGYDVVSAHVLVEVLQRKSLIRRTLSVSRLPQAGRGEKSPTRR
ncbi:uncharacterized protein VDAG_03524 [Verticillium dahliae VdLs.17]|uniref:Zinc finger PHD-type domain-containing protein n=1 Tax=Verticillium dahliae (strain VdLs.17 / ATCC MYA-4575 / FGSC 10137) TaxID=498257 RepID=G2WZT2_VERDV|nr:uncharacterized protein VDAG_03524 [Verticillium dahliae VdLs.17]EGY22084.1 hypothetical protein VDAG_03524 [Verticillium dahliae VdLs.17]KAH6703932.1 hypothetical protein EV126DRAFT_494127 [Verticillium dahliae]